MSAESGRHARHADHDEFAELAVGWALHALEPEDEALFARHLPDCRRCERDVGAAAEVLAAMARDLPDVDPPAALGARLLNAAQATEQVPGSDVLFLEFPSVLDLEADVPGPRFSDAAVVPGTNADPDRPRPGRPAPPDPVRRWLLPVGLAVVAVAAVVGLGAWNVFLAAAREDAQTTATAQSHALAALLQPGRATIAPLDDPAGRPVATVVVRGSQIQLITQGLPVDDALTHTYVLWGTRGGVQTALGTFDVGRPRMDLRTVGSAQAGVAEFPAYAISLEAGREAPPTPTEIVASGQVTS